MNQIYCINGIKYNKTSILSSILLPFLLPVFLFPFLLSVNRYVWNLTVCLAPYKALAIKQQTIQTCFIPSQIFQSIGNGRQISRIKYEEVIGEIHYAIKAQKRWTFPFPCHWSCLVSTKWTHWSSNLTIFIIFTYVFLRVIGQSMLLTSPFIPGTYFYIIVQFPGTQHRNA